MNLKISIFFLLLITLHLNGNQEECQELKEEAKEYREDLMKYTKRLYECLNNSNYTDDCYSEFRKVKSLHSDFESSISDISSECD